MTAEELISGLRQRGYRIHRSLEPNYVLIPRLNRDDPAAPWLGGLGARMTLYAPDQWNKPRVLVYEAMLQTCSVDDENGPRAIWEAARV